ncbi:MAG TPA: hypothetical protein ENI65_04160 [Gammaproteobacteria bacterium]|nr:hypothetical protein [Gammaproteobacteria bacterium]
MAKDFFKIPKKERPVTLWVHPEGRVLGSIFIREQSLHHIGEETPVELLNQIKPFLVIHRDDLNEYRFYNKSSIVRLEIENPAENNAEEDSIECELYMMDGSLISGSIRGAFPPDRTRLYDHLNKEGDQFIPLHQDDNRVLLMNKKYIIYAKAL